MSSINYDTQVVGEEAEFEVRVRKDGKVCLYTNTILNPCLQAVVTLTQEQVQHLAFDLKVLVGQPDFSQVNYTTAE